jgi:hypothetical protein
MVSPIRTNGDSVFVYFAHQSGRLVPAPDTRMRPEQCGLDPKQWRRCEAKGSKDIERVSIILSRQAWEEKKALHVGQKLREMAFLQQRAISARLRRAVNFSAKDAQVNEQLEKRWKDKQDQLVALVALEFDPTRRTTALEVELREAPINPHHLGHKRQGVSVG